MSRRRRRSTLTRNLWVVFWAAVGLFQVWDYQRTDKPPQPPTAEPDGRFVMLANPRLVEDAGNDGDSFKIAHQGRQQVLRLYFVDCPEKRNYALVSSRIQDQAGYFGGISVADTVRVGLEAKTFTEKLLRERPFTVQTRWTRVYNSERFYAMVFFEDGEELSEKLVKNGLCRIHTKGTRMPNGASEFEFENHLRALEQEARRGRRGAWGVKAGR